MAALVQRKRREFVGRRHLAEHKHDDEPRSDILLHQLVQDPARLPSQNVVKTQHECFAKKTATAWPEKRGPPAALFSALFFIYFSLQE